MKPKLTLILCMLMLATASFAAGKSLPFWMANGGQIQMYEGGGVETNLTMWLEFAVSNQVVAGFYPDSSGYGNDSTNATANRRPTWTHEGGTISAIAFDDSDDQLWISLTGEFVTSADITIALWIKHHGPGTTQTILVQGEETAPAYMTHSFYIDAADKLNYDNYRPSGGVLTSSSAISTNVWHYIAITRSANTVTFYLDGIADGGGTGEALQDSGSVDRTTTGARFYNGAWINPLVATIDEFRIYTRGLASNEVFVLFSGGQP